MTEKELSELYTRLALQFDSVLGTLVSKNLFPHLWEIDETAHHRVEQIMTELLAKNPAPDKSTQQLAWVQHMSSLKAQAEEIVNATIKKLCDGLGISIEEFFSSELFQGLDQEVK